jgi:hypothetical protein
MCSLLSLRQSYLGFERRHLGCLLARDKTYLGRYGYEYEYEYEYQYEYEYEYQYSWREEGPHKPHHGCCFQAERNETHQETYHEEKGERHETGIAHGILCRQETQINNGIQWNFKLNSMEF